MRSRNFLINSVLSSELFTPIWRRRGYRLLGLRRVGIVRSGVFFGGLDISMGSRTFVNARCFLDNTAEIRIGQDTRIAMGVTIVTSTHDVSASGSYSPTIGRRVVIGDNCWIGANATILPGVEICDDVIVGAGAVVTSSISQPGVYLGVPARFAREVIREPDRSPPERA